MEAGKGMAAEAVLPVLGTTETMARGPGTQTLRHTSNQTLILSYTQTHQQLDTLIHGHSGTLTIP